MSRTSNSINQALDAIELTEASLTSYKPFDPYANYSPKEQEPYHALRMRFTRAVEICLKFFRSYELLMEGTNSETIRDLLNKMERFEFIGSTLAWMEMRDIRNRIVHDYLPEDIERIYKSITGNFGKELSQLKVKLGNTEF